MSNSSQVDHNVLLASTINKVKAIFHSLPEEVQEKLLANKKIVKFRNNQFLQRYDDEVVGIWVVKKGLVRIGRDLGDEKFKVLLMVSPQDSFGELSCFSEIRRPIDAIATGDVEAYWISYEEFRETIEEFPEANKSIHRTLAGQLQQALDIFLINRLQDANQRLRWTLRFYCSDSKPPIQLPLSQNDLADMIGISRMTISKTLKVLEDQGILELDYGQVTILEPNSLIEKNMS